MLSNLRNRLWAHRSRRGASALEFALVAPVMLMMAFGTIDYGWYFSREALITSALDGAVRSGSNVTPAFGEGDATCAECVSTAAQYAVVSLNSLGITVSSSDMQPTIASVNGTCALILQPSINHEELIGLVDLPDRYNVQTIAMLQNVDGC